MNQRPAIVAQVAVGLVGRLVEIAERRIGRLRIDPGESPFQQLSGGLILAALQRRLRRNPFDEGAL